MGSGLTRFILWDYKRASWQYDVMVGIILAFIFFTPREIFRDQPRVPSVVMVPAEPGERVFWIEPDLLGGVPELQRNERAAELVRRASGKKQTITKVTPMLDAEQELKGFLVYTHR